MATKMRSPTYFLGVGLTRFLRPRGKVDYTELGFEAGIKAMLDAHITYDDVDQGIACYCYGDSTCGQRVFYQFGLTQIPIYNVNNNCASGSTGLVLARNLISNGGADCVLVVGFEKMSAGSLGSNFKDRTDPLGLATEIMRRSYTATDAPFAAQMFGNASLEYMQKNGAEASDFAEVARVNHEHSQQNPYSQFQDVYTSEQIHAAAMISEPLTKLQCCPTSDGGAAAVLVSQAFLDARPHLRSQAILIAGQALTTDSPALYSGSILNLVGYDMSRRAARAALAEADVAIAAVKAIELHDCFSSNEIFTIDALGLTPPGKGHEYVRAGQLTHGSRAAVINPSGGLISKGHPLGATGIAQCAELVWQLRGWANNRLVPVGPAEVALQHNAGLGGAAVVTLLRRADGARNDRVSSADVAAATGLGYNPAVEAKGFTAAQVNRVRSKERSAWALGDTERKVRARF